MCLLTRLLPAPSVGSGAHGPSAGHASGHALLLFGSCGACGLRAQHQVLKNEDIISRHHHKVGWGGFNSPQISRGNLASRQLPSRFPSWG